MNTNCNKRIAKWIGCMLSLVTIWLVPAWSSDIVQIGSLDERLDKTAKISGKVVRGVSAAGVSTQDRPILHSSIPAPAVGKTLCLVMTSSDGLYEGIGEFEIRGVSGSGFSKIEFQSSYSEYLANTKADRFAVRLSLGDCQNEKQTFLVTSWNQHPGEGAVTSWSVKINSFGANEVYLAADDGNRYSCSRSEGDHWITFDHVCELPAALFPKNSAVELTVIRIKRGDFLDPVSVRIEG